jgi:pentatricopeptide repeat protein
MIFEMRNKVYLILAVLLGAIFSLGEGFIESTSTAWKTATPRLFDALYASTDNEEEESMNGYKINDEAVVIPQDTGPIRTIGGGSNMIFEMARQMLLWEETEESAAPPPTASFLKNLGTSGQTSSRKNAKARAPVLPRWRPTRGVSDVNPSFRTQSPMMNSQGYAGTIWRNVRKANKPSLWRHALRTYDRMEQNAATSVSGSAKPNELKVQRTNLHHEGALVACAKLGLWKKALQIYHDVEQEEQNPSSYKKVYITDNMVLSLIRACVRGSRDPEAWEKSLEERREPLDACLEVLLTIEEKHGLPLVARHLNPVAAAFQKLGLLQEANNVLNANLDDRSSGHPEEENGDDPFNVNDVRAKDKGSYSLLVKGAVSEGNWAGAVDALRTMTELGLYPNSRNLNAWTEVSERKTKQRATRSWKKKRDEYWLESVR